MTIKMTNSVLEAKTLSERDWQEAEKWARSYIPSNLDAEAIIESSWLNCLDIDESETTVVEVFRSTVELYVDSNCDGF